MSERRVVIIGGGLAGLSAGCYARASGFRTTIVEHNLALGGVCTAWNRGPYTIDGCIHWLTGGAFQRLYEELGIVPRVPLRTMEQFLTYRDARDGLEVTISRDLEATARAFRELAPEDADEIRRLVDGAERLVNLAPPIDQPVSSPRCATSSRASGTCATIWAPSRTSASRLAGGPRNISRASVSADCSRGWFPKGPRASSC